MSKSYKLKDNNYIDSSSIVYEHVLLTDIIAGLKKIEQLERKVISTFDPNEITTGGLYQIARSKQTFQNVPSSIAYGVMLVLSASGGVSGAWQCTQIIFDNEGIIMFRNRVNNNWRTWKTITVT